MFKLRRPKLSKPASSQLGQRMSGVRAPAMRVPRLVSVVVGSLWATVVLVLVATLAIAAVAGSTAVVQVDQRTRAEANTRLDNHATSLARAIDARVAKTQDDLRLAATDQTLGAFLAQPASGQAANPAQPASPALVAQRKQVEDLVTYLAQRDGLDAACVVNASGVEVACEAYGRLLKPDELSINTRDADFRATVALGRYQVHVTEPFVSKASKRWVFGIASPIVLADKKVAGIVRFEIPVAWFEDEVHSRPFGGSGNAFVVSGDGHLLYHSAIDAYRQAANIPAGVASALPMADAKGSPSWNQLIANLVSGDTSPSTYQDGGRTWRASFQEIGGDRYVVSVTPTDELYAAVDESHQTLLVTVGPLAVLLLVVILLFAARLSRSNNRLASASRASAAQADQSRAENDRMQASIVKLLEEVSGAADGDLTVEAEVTTDVTGAIADAFNYTISQLRDLVHNVQETTGQVTASARELQAASGRLAEMGATQAEQIGTTLSTVGDLAASVEQVSDNATSSASVAQRSLAAAVDGARAVAATIEGMSRIRDRVQETGQRTKRLGERSQEIGEAVTLIDEIADRTSILALNASIQAASAGDAGRGFTVVAEEIQRLAERSADATRRIALLVKTVQSETHEAVVSLDDVTREVVEGSGLADQAGQKLHEIESISGQLAQLVESISEAAAQQALQAAELALSIGEISVVTNQNAQGASESADEMGVLVTRAERLGESVSVFRLTA
jgi:methyl-accepting chemotaxis protein